MSAIDKILAKNKTIEIIVDIHGNKTYWFKNPDDYKEPNRIQPVSDSAELHFVDNKLFLLYVHAKSN